MKKLAIVVPCYNEEPVLEDTARQLTDLLSDLIAREKVSPDSFILFVNDGSTDGTWRLIEQAYAGSRLVCGLNLAANVGHQNALLAGLSSVQQLCDVTITIDADLQDDIAVMEEMIDQFEAGADIVYGVRKERKTADGGKIGVQPRGLPSDERARRPAASAIQRTQSLSARHSPPHRLSHREGLLCPQSPYRRGKQIPAQKNAVLRL